MKCVEYKCLVLGTLEDTKHAIKYDLVMEEDPYHKIKKSAHLAGFQHAIEIIQGLSTVDLDEVKKKVIKETFDELLKPMTKEIVKL